MGMLAMFEYDTGDFHHEGKYTLDEHEGKYTVTWWGKFPSGWEKISEFPPGDLQEAVELFLSVYKFRACPPQHLGYRPATKDLVIKTESDMVKQLLISLAATVYSR